MARYPEQARSERLRNVARFILALAVLWSATLVAQSGSFVEPMTHPDAYAVYRMILGTPDSEVVIQQETIVKPTCSAGGSAFERDWREVLADYRAANSRRWTLLAGLLGQSSYRVVPETTLAQAAGPDFWRAFPNGYVRVSAIGFDREGTRALVYVERVGRMGTRGHSTALEKINDRWVRTERTDIHPCTMGLG